MIDRLRTSRGGLATMISMFMLFVGARRVSPDAREPAATRDGWSRRRSEAERKGPDGPHVPKLEGRTGPVARSRPRGSSGHPDAQLLPMPHALLADAQRTRRRTEGDGMVRRRPVRHHHGEHQPQRAPVRPLRTRAATCRATFATPPRRSWHFLVGDQQSIETLADTVGFGYRFDEKTGEYAHTSSIIFPDTRGPCLEVHERRQVQSTGSSVRVGRGLQVGSEPRWTRCCSSTAFSGIRNRFLCRQRMEDHASGRCPDHHHSGCRNTGALSQGTARQWSHFGLRRSEFDRLAKSNPVGGEA